MANYIQPSIVIPHLQQSSTHIGNVDEKTDMKKDTLPSWKSAVPTVSLWVTLNY